MATATKQRLVTFLEFCERIPQGQKADLIEGVIYVASPDNIEHHNIGGWLYRLLGDFLEEKGIAGCLFHFRIAFRLDKFNAPEPDLAYVRPERTHLVQDAHIAGPPDWAVEIISPDSIQRDYRKKRKQYQRFRVPEYWIIDPLQQRTKCYRLTSAGKYQEIRMRGGKIVSQVIPGFWLRPNWLWQYPLPSKAKALKEILAPPSL